MKAKIAIIIFSILLFFKQVYALENKILFKVNNKIITSIDIQNEMNYLNSINPSFKDLKKEKMFEISKNSLIKNKVKEITLEKIIKEIELDDTDFERVLISIYSNLGIRDITKLKEYLLQFDISIQLLKKRMAIDSFWNQVIYDMYNKNIKIDLDEIKNNLLKDNIQKEFLLSEIVFNLDVQENFEDKYEDIKQSIDEKGFENSALIYSISDSVSVGGKLGWINENSINQKILNEILLTEVDNHTKPIKMPNGFIILKINEIRETEKNFNLDEELQKIIRTKTNEQLNQYSNLFFNKIRKDVVINEF